MPDPKNRWRRIAGTLELFLGSYFAACGCLAAMFFLTLENRQAVLLSIVSALVGMLLVFRAGHLLAWRPWLFKTVAFIMIVAPVAWVTPAFLSASVEMKDARYRRELASTLSVRSAKAHELSPAVPKDMRNTLAYRWAVTTRDAVESVTGQTYVWCMEKLQSFMSDDEKHR